MTATASAAALDPARWQPVLDRHAELFEPLDRGAAAAILCKADWDAGRGEVLELRAGEGMRAALRPWAGVARADVDLVFVALRDALDRLAAVGPEARLELLKGFVHRGDVLFFVMKTKCKLLDAGWEEFLDSLGLAFMGACR